MFVSPINANKFVFTKELDKICHFDMYKLLNSHRKYSTNIN